MLVRPFVLLTLLFPLTLFAEAEIIKFPERKRPPAEEPKGTALVVYDKEKILKDFNTNSEHALKTYAEAKLPFPSGDAKLDEKIRRAYETPYAYFDRFGLSEVDPAFTRKVFPELANVKTWDDLEKLLKKQDTALSSAAIFELMEGRINPTPKQWRDGHLRKIADLFWDRTPHEMGPMYVLLRKVNESGSASRAWEEPLLARMEKYLNSVGDLHTPGWNDFVIRSEGMKLLAKLNREKPLSRTTVLRLGAIATSASERPTAEYLKHFGSGPYAEDAWRTVVSAYPSKSKTIMSGYALGASTHERAVEWEHFLNSNLPKETKRRLISEALNGANGGREFMAIMLRTPELAAKNPDLIKPEFKESFLKIYSFIRKDHVELRPITEKANLGDFLNALKDPEGTALAKERRMAERGLHFDRMVKKTVSPQELLGFLKSWKNNSDLRGMRPHLAHILAMDGGPEGDGLRWATLDLFMDENHNVRKAVAEGLADWKDLSPRIRDRMHALLMESDEGKKVLAELDSKTQARIRRSFIAEVPGCGSRFANLSR